MPDAEFEWGFSGESTEETPEVEAGLADGLLPPDTPPRRKVTRRRRVRRRVVLISLLAISAIGVALYALITRRIDEITDPVKKEIRSAYELMQSAVEQSDGDLFVSLQSPDNLADWRNIQRRMFERGLLFDRSLLGLPLQSTGPAQVEVDFAPGETRAEVLADYVYVTDAGNGVPQTVRLRQTMPYRFERQRWLLGPPDGAFWGEEVIVKNRFVVLIYPERDEPVGRRLAGDLDRLLGNVCPHLGDVTCPMQLPLWVQLTKTPRALVALIDQAGDSTFFDSQARRGDTLVLPAPTLIGLPTDEASYQAVYRLYASQMPKTLLAQRGGRQMNRFIWTYYRSRLDMELIWLGLRSRPADVQRAPSAVSIVDVQQDVVLYCVEDGVAGGSLVRYTPATGEWRTELSDRKFISLMALPNGRGIVLQEQWGLTEPASSRILLWQAGTEHTLFSASADTSPGLFVVGVDPVGRNLVVVLNAPRDSSLDEAMTYHALNLERCDDKGCVLESLSGWPIWSPDGSQLLVADSYAVLYRSQGSRRSPERVAAGFSPFWLDDKTFGYINPFQAREGPRRADITIASIDESQARQVVLGLETLTAFLATEGQHSQVDVNSVMADPADPNLFLIVAGANRVLPLSEQSSSQFGHRTYLLLLDRRSAELSLPFTFDNWPAVAEFSPDGRWLVVSNLDPTAKGQALQFLNVEQGQVETVTLPATADGASFFTRRNWSNDGRWFLLLRGGVLHFIAPGQGLQQTVVPESPGCVFAAWVDRQ